MMTNDAITERHGIRLGQAVCFRYLGAEDSGIVLRLTLTKATVKCGGDWMRSIAYRQIRESDVYREK